MLPVILVASLMASFDYMVVNVAAPSLQRDLHAGSAALELVVAGYGFTYAAAMVTGGRLGDLFGHRRLFLLGMSGFTLASLGCGLAGTAGELVGARMVQGLTAAAMVPQVLALISRVFPAGERARAISWFGVALGVGGTAGQVLGGLLLQADLWGLGWRVIFLVNLPIGLVTVVLAGRWLPVTRADRQPRLDPLGSLGLSAALALVLVPLALGRQAGWAPWIWLLLAAAVPVGAATLRWERRLAARGAEPLLDPALFAARSFSAGLVVTVAFMAGFGSFMFVLTLLAQGGLGLDALRTGLAFLPLGLLTMASSLAGRRLVARYGLRVLVAGNLLTITGMLLLAAELHLRGAAMTQSWLLAPLGLVGLGCGLTVPALVGSVLSGVRPDQAGAASGVLSTAQQFAGAAGVAVLGSVFFAVLGGHPGRAEFVRAAQWALLLDLLLVVGATALIALLRPRPAAPAPAGVTAAQSVLRPAPLLDRRM